MGNVQKKAARHQSKSPYASSGPVKKVYWDGPGLPSPPGKPILIPGEEDSQSDIVDIRWERSPSNGGSAIIGYHVEHRKMGSSNWVKSMPVLCTFPELTMSGLEPGWRYQFRIRAQNALGFSEPSELSDPLTVTLQRTTSIAPRFDTELKDCVTLEGEQAEFSIVYLGIPIPKVSWFKDGFEIFSSRRTTITTDTMKSVLIIHKTLIDDEGEIKCSATNRTGHISTRAKLTIEAPPHVRLPRQYEDGLLFEQGETIRLKATNSGRPPPSITWYHNNEIIVIDQRHNFESITDNEVILKIQDAKRQDRGEYSIKAINKLGEDVESFLVTVTDRPAAPGKTVVMGILGRSVMLGWEEPDDDGGCKIGTYIVEYYRLGWDMWLKAVTCRKTTVTLHDLIEGSEYRFRVKAENPYGLSDSSEESETLFIPDPKRGITEINMRVKSVSQRDIPRGHTVKREMKLNNSAQRTRSLNREDSSNCKTRAIYECTASSQRLIDLANSNRISRADSSVTFALDSTGSEKDESKWQWHKEILPESGELDIGGRAMSPHTAVIVKPIFDDSGGQRSYLESRSRLASLLQSHRFGSLTVKEMAEIEIKKSVENCESETSSFLLPQRRRSSTDLQDAVSLRTIQLEDEESILHDSSEFMLVLYPQEEEVEIKQTKRMENDSETMRRNNVSIERLSRSYLIDQLYNEELEYCEEDLIPPSMSLSLPELFSKGHHIVKIIRKAISSTELLYERAMERFYRAVQVEKSVNQTQIKFQSSDKSGKKLLSTRSDNDTCSLINPQIRTMRRCLSNSGGIITTWLLKRDRRRSSEGQAKVSPLKAPNVFVMASLKHVSSDPNLLTDKKIISQNIELSSDFKGSVERLHRWHEPGLELSNEKSITEIIDKQNTPIKEEKLQKLLDFNFKDTSRIEDEYNKIVNTDEILAEDIVETSGVSSEDKSINSQDLKQLKTRIIAIPIDNAEDTYHPCGQMTMLVDSKTPPPVTLNKVSLHDFSTPIPDRMNLSLMNLIQMSNSANQPKSILKKHVETEFFTLNQFGRPISPEKSIRKSLSIYNDTSIHFPSSSKSVSNWELSKDNSVFETNFSVDIPPSTTAITDTSTIDADIDKEAVISAGEAAIIKRKQMRQSSKTILLTEDNEDEREEKMSVVSHYTEIVQQYSNPEFRQRSLSRDRGERCFESPLESRVTSSVENIQSNMYKERLSIIPGRIITSISSMVPLMKSKIITRIPSAMQSVVLQKAKPIITTEQNSRCRNLINKINEMELGAPITIRRYKNQESVTNTIRSMNSSVEDSRHSISKQKRTENRSSSRNESRPSSRNESPICRSRNISMDQGSLVPESRSLSAIKGKEFKSQSGNKISSAMKNTRPSSRSSSKDRTNTPIEMQMEQLHRALDNKKDRLQKTSTTDDIRIKGEIANIKNIMLAIEAEKKVRTTISYVTDVVLLFVAMYVYLFKKEILAIPIIGLLLYRYIQKAILNWIPTWWDPENRRY